ncbi:hypothetical protein HG717_03200 [Rhodococcus erythropolis]|uniref:hypothetical protein n=1 Tax=Rhodococcus erythropolis TaxID=1833 RepID=UPI001C9A5D82|nr:hypothetical protein [Rhodococcus erythropolis]MBY6382922.1 hypothetical protein [Rhodococcus erythropolis]
MSSSAQSRTDRFLDDSETLVSSDLAALRSSTALLLNVGLPPNKPLLRQPDLDRYAFLLSERLKQDSGQQFASVWCTKRHSDISTISVGSAIPIQPSNFGQTTTLLTRRSYGKEQFKSEIRDAVADLTPVEDGPVALHISYVTGLPRTWANLWRPTIEGLGNFLGMRKASKPWDVDAGRIVQLALHHRTEGPSLGHSVQITVTAEKISLETI